MDSSLDNAIAALLADADEIREAREECRESFSFDPEEPYVRWNCEACRFQERVEKNIRALLGAIKG